MFGFTLQFGLMLPHHGGKVSVASLSKMNKSFQFILSFGRANVDQSIRNSNNVIARGIVKPTVFRLDRKD